MSNYVSQMSKNGGSTFLVMDEEARASIAEEVTNRQNAVSAEETARENADNELKSASIQELYNVDCGIDNNLVNIKSFIQGVSLNSATGAMIPYSGYMVSQKIVADFTKRIIVGYSTVGTPNLYCYDKNDAYLGRFECNNTGDTASVRFPDTYYARIETKTEDVNIGVFYAMGEYDNEYNSAAGWIRKSKDVKLLKNSALQESMYGNLYNPNEALHGKDIAVNTGVIINDERYMVSGKIVSDFTKRTTIANCSYRRFYCYDANNNYLGYYDPGSSESATPANMYPTTAYYRFAAKETDTNIMVCYAGHFIDAFIPYSGIRKAWENCIINDPINLRIGSYNMGDFTGTGLTPGTDGTAETYRRTIGKINAEICGFQFDIRTFGDHGDAMDYIVTQKRWMDWHGNNNRNYDYFGVGSDYLLANEGKVMYANAGGYNLTHTWFEVFDLFLHGKEVHFINLHLEWQDNDMRYQQITEVLAHAANYSNCIIIGDFNPEDRTNGEWNGPANTLTYEADLQRFKDAGFTPGNAGPFGVFNTIADGQLNGPWDNILAKVSIVIKNFGKIE